MEVRVKYENGFRFSATCKGYTVTTGRGEDGHNERRHEYQLYLTLEDIKHSKNRAMSSQSSDICERFHKTVLDEFYRVTFRRKIYNTLDE
jgi:hypothetical protein